MADFFDVGDVDDLNLIHSSVRDHDELATVTDSVEWEIINRYRQRPCRSNYRDFFRYENGTSPSDLQVRLIGFDADNPAGSDADLKEALRRTIADVVSWVLRGYDTPNGVQSIQQGQRSVTYESVPSMGDWPHGWDNKLSNFDAREVSYGI